LTTVFRPAIWQRIKRQQVASYVGRYQFSDPVAEGEKWPQWGQCKPFASLSPYVDGEGMTPGGQYSGPADRVATPFGGGGPGSGTPVGPS